MPFQLLQLPILSVCFLPGVSEEVLSVFDRQAYMRGWVRDCFSFSFLFFSLLLSSFFSISFCPFFFPLFLYTFSLSLSAGGVETSKM